MKSNPVYIAETAMISDHINDHNLCDQIKLFNFLNVYTSKVKLHNTHMGLGFRN